MWWLETIVQLNETAAELAAQGRPERDAYALCGIDCSDNRRLVEKFEAEKHERKRLKVVA